MARGAQNWHAISERQSRAGTCRAMLHLIDMSRRVTVEYPTDDPLCEVTVAAQLGNSSLLSGTILRAVDLSTFVTHRLDFNRLIKFKLI